MSDYKKKRNSNIRVKRKSTVQYSDEYDKIELKPKQRNKKSNTAYKSKSKPKSRQQKINKFFVYASLLIVAVVAYIIVCLSHPVGLLEYVSYLYKSIGTGNGYEVLIEGGKPIYTVSAKNKYFTVTDTTVNCYNKFGKTIFEKSHSFADPVLKFGDTRYIFYGQGEKELWVSTLSETKYKLSFAKGIIAAAISDSGNFAVATKAEGYDSSVSVFNKNNKKIFEWFSTDSTINSVALSKSGKLLAVSTLKVQSGKYISNIYILNLKSANPIHSFTYDGEVVYQLGTMSQNNFYATFGDNIEFFSFKSGMLSKNESDYSLSIVKKNNNRLVVVRTIAANQDESLVEIYNPRGKLLSSFEVQSYIDDVTYNHGNVYLLGLSKVFRYDLRGKLLSAADTSFDSLYIEAISQDSVACIKNSTIDKCKLTSIKE